MYKKLIQLIRTAWGFSRTEANGFIILSCLLLLFMAVPYITKRVLIYNTQPLVSAEDERALDSLVQYLEAHKLEVKANQNKLLPRTFDPNTISEDSLAAFGLPTYLANRIVNYRTKVKPFYEASDLAKIYGLDSSLYEQLRPFIAIDKSQLPKEKVLSYESKSKNERVVKRKDNYEKSRRFKLEPFNLNDADTVQLKKIYGIGSTYAKRIVSFRELLGGYNSITQLNEVYGLESPSKDSLLKYVVLPEKPALKLLRINSLTADELAKHPYISYKTANLMVAYRKQHGAFKEMEDLRKIKPLKGDLLKKLAPYLTFNE